MDTIIHTVKIGNRYLHYKGNIYIVLGLPKDCETLEEFVFYQNISTGESWIRSIKSFISFVDVKDRSVPRFRQLTISD